MGLSHVLVDIAPLRRSPPFRRLWGGWAMSEFGNQMTLVAVMFQVWHATGSTVWTGSVGVAQAVPVVTLGLFAGSLADRTDRKKFYLVTTAGQAVCSLLLAGQGFFGPVPVGGVLLLVALQSCFTAGGGSVFGTFVPRLLPRRSLAAGLALNRIALQAAMIAGPAAGGVVLGWLGLGGCYLIDAITFGLAFYGALGLPPMSPDGGRAQSGVRGVRDGVAFLIGNPVVRGVLLADVATTVLSMPISLFPLMNAQRFDDNPRTLGLFLSAIAVGGGIASVLSGIFTRLPCPGSVMLCGSAAWGGSLMLSGLSRSPWWGLGFLAVAGAADTVAVVSRATVVQLHTPDALLGRVVAAEQIVGRAGPDLGNLRAGVTAGLTSAATALVSGGLLCTAAVAAIATTTPQLRRGALHPLPRSHIR